MQPPHGEHRSRGSSFQPSILTTHHLSWRVMSSMSSLSAKICATCSRQITWRKKWEKNWESTIYCSDSCRKHKIKPKSLDTAFESKILSLLDERKKAQGAAAIVTCEEAEADVPPELKSSKNRNQYNEEAKESAAPSELKSQPPRTRERCRQAARRLAARGSVLVTQNGKVVDPSFAKGVMELKLPS